MTQHDAVESRIHDLSHAQRAVWRKIQKVFALDDAAATLPPEAHAHYTHAIDEIVSADQWQQRRDRILAAAGLDAAEAAPRLDAAAATILRRYYDAFNVRQQVYDCDTATLTPENRVLYGQWNMRRHLVEIYVNHASNRNEQELQALGLDAHSAHLLHGHLIGEACSSYSKNSIACVNPELGSARNASHEELDRRIDTLAGYWRGHANYLRHAHQEHKGAVR